MTILKMTPAINNVIEDLGGIICDGDKPGCYLKAIYSAVSAMRTAFLPALQRSPYETFSDLMTRE